MTKKELAEILKYSFSSEILVVTQKNKLHLVRCPFNVITIQPVGTIKEGEILMVNEVKVTRSVVTVYIIDNAAYYYHYFDIII